ncbi:hypothetical protein A3A60_02860 [Candidatus Curtissbacteria bacterium RIFCSPLOWO2_01_FULL_42_26]|uniref:Uncharacterized protein n=1 Tax=Candidatus Curtissbacteria bacterium RIFCSPLOWO2_01_FULL_42_26 TaxID=1797729 RepID=A0A1F5HXX7_9BACT|nr:MAG: hypothetical protein A3A60_02860 [Candidatus Curtissbacteria bacterium RIFCSPLOWO2_01_FULL_42_26]
MTLRQYSKTTILDRHCVVCGKKILIKVYPSKKYQGGHFFGKVELENGKKAEYWECNKCYYN